MGWWIHLAVAWINKPLWHALLAQYGILLIVVYYCFKVEIVAIVTLSMFVYCYFKVESVTKVTVSNHTFLAYNNTLIFQAYLFLPYNTLIFQAYLFLPYNNTLIFQAYLKYSRVYNFICGLAQRNIIKQSDLFKWQNHGSCTVLMKCFVDKT